MKRHWKIITLTTIIIFSWLLFPFLTYGERSVAPLFFLVLQLMVILRIRNKKLLLLLLLNPAIFFPVLNTIGATINYARGRPTKIHCSSHQQETVFDPEQGVYMSYHDDDCDWEGMYFY